MGGGGDQQRIHEGSGEGTKGTQLVIPIELLLSDVIKKLSVVF